MKPEGEDPVREAEKWKIGAAIGAIALALGVGTYLVLATEPSNRGTAVAASGLSPRAGNHFAAGGNPEPSSGGSGGTGGAQPAGANDAGTAKPAAVPALPKEEYDRKVVPVLSIGDGVRIGVVLVGGPRSYVEKTKAVIAVEGDWKDVIVYKALIPIYTEKIVEKIERVPFVGVIGVIDLKIT